MRKIIAHEWISPDGVVQASSYDILGERVVNYATATDAKTGGGSSE